MSYFKRLTESRQLGTVPDIRQFAPSTDRQEDYMDDLEELPKGMQTHRPYRSFKLHSHERMFRRQKLLLASTFKERMQKLQAMVPQTTSPASHRFAQFEQESSKYSRQERCVKEIHMLSHTSMHPVAHQPKIAFSQNTSPIKQTQEQPPTSMHASMKMSEQFFTHFIKVMEKMTEERKDRPAEVSMHNPTAFNQMRYDCHHEQSHCMTATQMCNTTTPTHHHQLNSMHSPYMYREYSAQQPHDYSKQPPIIINNIIKPEDRRTHWGDRTCHEEDSYSRRERSTIDEKLEHQQMIIKKLESERRAHSSFNQTLKLNSTGKHNMSNANESQHESSRPTGLGRTAPVSKQLAFPVRDTSMTCIEDDNSSENEIIRQLKREEQDRPLAATNDNSQQQIEQEVSCKKKPREFSAMRRQSNFVQPPPLPPNSSNKRPKQSLEQSNVKPKDIAPEVIPENYEIKPPVSFEFPMSNSGPSRELSLAQAFQLRRGDIASRQKTKRDKSKPEKTKEQLAQLRKEMMKRHPKEENIVNFQNIVVSSQKQSRVLRDASNASSCKREPSRDLMDRLIGGVKAKIDQREMKALTTKNYNDLPEIRQKRDEQRRRQEFARRMQAKKQFERSLRVRH